MAQIDRDVALAPPLQAWLSSRLGEPGPFSATPIGGGRSNQTLALRRGAGEWILRRPPAHALAPGAHDMAREARVLRALAGTGVPVPEVYALCDDEAVAGAPFIVMERVEGVTVTDRLPAGYPPGAATVRAIGEAVVDALALLHTVDWSAAGLEGFGRPEGFLERQVSRWRRQYERAAVRELPLFEPLARWLEDQRPEATAPAILHGDFRLDNCLLSAAPPVRLAAIVDWEMATIGDPMLDLALFLAFWGDDRPATPALAHVQAISRGADAPSRGELAARYAERSGRSVERLDWYLALALWKLAAIVEGAYAQFATGAVDSEYARSLELEVPRLLEEAAALSSLAPSADAAGAVGGTA